MKISTENLAIYGAITATCSLFFQFVVIYRDKKRVFLKYPPNEKTRVVNFGSVEAAPYPCKANTDYIRVLIINKGRRPVVIVRTGAMLYTKNTINGIAGYLYKENSPLKEGEYCTFYVEKSKVDMSKVIYFFARDATWKCYKLYVDNFVYRLFKWAFYSIKVKLTKRAQEES